MFGLLNTPFYFSKLIVRALGGLENYALPYIDNIAFFLLSWERHFEDNKVLKLKKVLKCLKEADLTAKPS